MTSKKKLKAIKDEAVYEYIEKCKLEKRSNHYRIPKVSDRSLAINFSDNHRDGFHSFFIETRKALFEYLGDGYVKISEIVELLDIIDSGDRILVFEGSMDANEQVAWRYVDRVGGQDVDIPEVYNEKPE